jgi:hypothetical protein
MVNKLISWVPLQRECLPFWPSTTTGQVEPGPIQFTAECLLPLVSDMGYPLRNKITIE